MTLSADPPSDDSGYIPDAESVAFTAGLAYLFKPLLPALSEHLSGNSGQVLPHVLMGVYCRILCCAGENAPWTGAFIAHLGEHFDVEDNPVSNVIALSFIFNLPNTADMQEWPHRELTREMKDEFEEIVGLDRS